ncbi:MAG: peptidoglycan-associated lipoprotein Pal [Halothiobacillaceae bacterium]|nr:peptidoglycan-associated lipoprotein Pal [Halothiobacillaceae bacterium]
MRMLKTSALILAMLGLAACSSTPEEGTATTGAGTGTGSSTSGLSGSDYDESKLYAGKPSQINSTVYFDYDSYVVSQQYRPVITENATFIGANGQRQVTIEGYTDERGSAEYNIALGEKRAMAVRDALILQGVNSAQVSIVSYGEEKPSCSSADETCYSQERRAEMVYGKR